MKTCPYCAEAIQSAARVCRYCQSDVSAVKPPPFWHRRVHPLVPLILALIVAAIIYSGWQANEKAIRATNNLRRAMGEAP